MAYANRAFQSRTTNDREQRFRDLHARRSMTQGVDTKDGEWSYAASRANVSDAQELDIAQRRSAVALVDVTGLGLPFEPRSMPFRCLPSADIQDRRSRWPVSA